MAIRDSVTSMLEALVLAEEQDDDDLETAWIRIRDTQAFLEPLSMSIAETAGTERTNITRLVLLSDTHGSHRDILLPDGDVLIHGGDFTRKGELSIVKDLSSWFGEESSKFSEIVCIAGNHDLPFEKEFYEQKWKEFNRKKSDPEEVRASLRNCTYLEDSSHTFGDGDLTIYGSPWSPFFFGWAFNLQRGAEILEKWQQIPERTDILVTHGPPLGRGDLASPYQGKPRRTGCFDLLKEVQTRVKPRVHIFGHIHEGRGVSFDGQTLFVNACNVNLQYQAVHQCFVIDVPHDKNCPAVVIKPDCTIRSNELKSWFEERKYTGLASRMGSVELVESLPSGNDLLQEDAFMNLCEAMQLHRDQAARKQLRKALSQMHVESLRRN